MILNIGLTLIVAAMLFTVFLEVLREPFEMLFPKTASRIKLRKKRIALEQTKRENVLLEQQKIAIEKQKALEDFLAENKNKWDLE